MRACLQSEYRQRQYQYPAYQRDNGRIVERLDMDWLDAAPNTPILKMERIVFASDNTPIEFLVARFRGDRFKYQITL